ncbi:MAG: M2 family metallopeptidase, partial [Bacteroidota bacterium]|nr:M2 family metallopeptidase [Bacteroidota bacterium]
MKKVVFSGLLLASFWSCQSKKNYKSEAETFLTKYSKEYQKLYTASAEAEWASNTKIIEGDSSNAIATRKANEAYAAFTGSKENIQQLQSLLQHKEELDEIQVKQLETALRAAANNPQTVAGLVKSRIKAETEQSEKLYGFDYKLNGKSVTTNQIDEILRTETDPEKRLQAWQASKEVGTVLKTGLVNLR